MKETTRCSEIIDRYLANYKLQIELDKELYHLKPRDEWIAAFRKRAEILNRLLAENQRLIEQLQALLSEELTETSAQQIYEQAYRMFWDEECMAVCVCLPMVYKLIPYYEQRDDMHRLIFLYEAAYILESEQAKRESRPRGCHEFNRKIVAYRDRYKEFTAVDKSIFWAAYNNLSIVTMTNHVFDLETSHHYWKEAMDFWESEAVQEDYRKTGKSPLIYLNRWILAEEFMDEASPEIRDEFCQLAKRLYEEERIEHADPLAINSEIYGAYLHMQVILGEKTFDEIVDEYFDYYLRKIRSDFDLENLSTKEFYFIINTPLITENWLKKCVDQEKSKRIMRTFHENFRKFWQMKHFSTPFVNEFFAVWCSKMIGYLDTAEEKEACVCQLILRRQLPTYLHCVMVMKLAEILCREAIRTDAALFSDIRDIPLENMGDFVKKCAQLHDLGKTKITDIINTQTRKITDSEFRAIMNHPNFGAEILGLDRELNKFRDVILGHHKFYDGSAGYPAEFDNTQSGYRIIIDMVTICDCIDAATDYLGRNYKHAKTFDEVLCELIAGKGVRYNPHLVELMEHSESVCSEMRELVEKARSQLMYNAYINGVNEDIV